MAVFRKIWCALFSYNNRSEIYSFVLLPAIWGLDMRFMTEDNDL